MKLLDDVKGEYVQQQELNKIVNDDLACLLNKDCNVNIMKTIECGSLQTSKYVIIENDVNKLRKQYQFLKNLNQIETIDGFTDSISKARGKLNLSYCPENDVLRKRLSFLLFKSSFLAQHKQLQ